ncbi:MAG TPA: N-methyl-L-tryptophan oxidase [Candidatus Krumholzibacteria bacterium]|nr:N-methyl-L-tryptophan oxidase [Candidatus Krumholzibacteria bacterium]
MTTRYDCIVAGLGAVGSAALYHLAARGARVAGLDAHDPPHTLGSSHGESRMIREAYFEDPCYVPLVRRAYDLWHALQTEAGTTLIEETGGIYAGFDGDELVPGMIRAASEHAISVEKLSLDECTQRFPWLRPDPQMLCAVEPRAGLLHPERCISAHLAGARARGAAVRTDEALVAWRAHGDHIVVQTTAGTLLTDTLIMATGAAMPATVAEAGATAAVARQPLFWFEPADPGTARAIPVWAVEFEKGRLLYGFPDRGRGVKVAIHDPGMPTTPEGIDRIVHEREVARVRALCDRYLPGMLGALRETATCMYTNTPDGHFLIDAHPRHDNVLLVSACSGHGFKFASATGEAAAQWMLDGKPALDLSPFSLRRFRSDAR